MTVRGVAFAMAYLLLGSGLILLAAGVYTAAWERHWSAILLWLAGVVALVMARLFAMVWQDEKRRDDAKV
jgi:hypothetical protein